MPLSLAIVGSAPPSPEWCGQPTAEPVSERQDCGDDDLYEEESRTWIGVHVILQRFMCTPFCFWAALRQPNPATPPLL
jgi:hypothetical protein